MDHFAVLQQPALQSTGFQALDPTHDEQLVQALASLQPSLQAQASDPTNFPQRYHQNLNYDSQQHEGTNLFNRGSHSHLQPISHGITNPDYPHGQLNVTSFGLLSSPRLIEQAIPQATHQQHEIKHADQNDGLLPALEPESPTGEIHSQFPGLKLIRNPPNLQEWRERLFHVDQMIVLTEEQFQVYFPHIDNVYSHRSTQRYKRKQFISHYWDCRLKGRPPGTAKSTDPAKKKRKRVARERDLCDVKIKITECMPGTRLSDIFADIGQNMPSDSLGASELLPILPNATSTPTTTIWPNHLAMSSSIHPGMKYYTIQRVNGNGANGKADGIPGPHKHTLEESDKVKKNSVLRWLLKLEKDKKRSQVGRFPVS